MDPGAPRGLADDVSSVGAEHFSIAFNGTRDMMVLFAVEPGPTLRLLAANTEYEAALRRLGFSVSAGELAGRTLQQVCELLAFPAENARALIARYEQVVASKLPLSLEEMTDTPLGPHYGETVLTPVTDAVGKCTHVLYAARDITDRKLAERALRESEARLRQVFRSTPVAMLIVELESGRILEANARSLELFGACESSAFVYRWYSADEGARFLARLRAGQAWPEGESRLLDRSGEPCVCLVSGESMVLGGVVCALLAFQNVTLQRKMAQDRLEIEAKLVQAQKLEALGTLAAGIAHDFNNILTAIVSYTELTLIDAENPVHVREYATEVRQASDRATGLVRRILSFGRKNQPERRPIALHAVVREAAKLLRSSLPTSLEIYCEVDERAPRVLADATQIHQIIMNLGTNAAHAMVGTPGKLEIRVLGLMLSDPELHGVPALEPGLFTVLEVSDTGHGMDEATVSRAFDPFFTTKGPGEGTGLGLAMVHGIVRECGGAISVHSRVGEGTRFQVYFPAFDSERDDVSGAAPPALGRSEHILLLDDEVTVGESTRRLLGRLGYRVSSFTDPLQALASFRATPADYALVITDLTMPNMSGLEFAQEVLRVRADVPVFLASGFSGGLTRERVRAVGIRDLLTKPMSAVNLASEIRRALDASSSLP